MYEEKPEDGNVNEEVSKEAPENTYEGISPYAGDDSYSVFTFEGVRKERRSAKR